MGTIWVFALIGLAAAGLACVAEPTVQVSEVDEYQGQASFKIVTPRATWYYHKAGAGFAGLIDADGNDWISFRPTGGSDGSYRGIPNLVHPEGYFHPGGTECDSRVVGAEPNKVTIESTAAGGAWAVRWEIGPQSAHLTVLAASKEYWFLYEGTPGGSLDESRDFCVRSPGVKTAAAEKWDEVLAKPKWVVFGDPAVGRVLYVVHHTGGEEIDSYWPMQQNMTVFGFGRQHLGKFLTATPTRFTVGLAEMDEYEAVVESVVADDPSAD